MCGHDSEKHATSKDGPVLTFQPPLVSVLTTLNALTLFSGGTVNARGSEGSHACRKRAAGGDLELLHDGKGSRVRAMNVAMHTWV